MASDQPPLFAWRDAWMSEDGPESSTTRLVLHTLAAHMYANLSGKCCPGSRSLAKETALARRTVLDHLKRARELGWIAWAEDTGEGVSWRSRTYVPTCPIDSEGGDEDSPTSPDGAVSETHRPSSEGGDRASPPSGRQQSPWGGDADAKGGESGNEGWCNSQQGVVTEAHRRMLEDTEDGEDGQEGAESSPSLRSGDLSGEAGDVKNSQDGNRPVTNLSRDELLERGPQAVGARFGPLLRKHLYPPDGRPPKGYADGQDIKILHDLLQQGHRPECLELAIVGLAYERDVDKLEAAGPGDKVTARLLRSDVAGARNPVSHFENIGRRLQAGELDKNGSGGRRSGDGPTRVGAAQDQLTPAS